MKKSLLIIFLIFLYTGCASFHETYKPLYQVKPEVEDLK